MHEMQTIVTDVSGVCLSVTLVKIAKTYADNEYHTKSKLRCWVSFNKEDSNTYANHGKDLEEPESAQSFQASQH